MKSRVGVKFPRPTLKSKITGKVNRRREHKQYLKDFSSNAVEIQVKLFFVYLFGFH